MADFSRLLTGASIDEFTHRKEIQDFVSGKSEENAWRRPKVSAALTEAQKEILEKRGVLDPSKVR